MGDMDNMDNVDTDETTDNDIDMVRLNALLEQPVADKEALRQYATQKLWDKWLWRTDATEELHKDCLANGCHLLGLSICRMRAVLTNTSTVVIANTLKCKQASITRSAVNVMTLRELRDSVSNLQLSWKKLMQSEDVNSLYVVVDACFHRFGTLLLRPLPVDTADDTELCEEHKGDSNLRVVNLSCIRTTIAFFFIAYRHLHLAAQSVELTSQVPLVSAFEPHLISAGMEDFYSLSMYYDLNMANVLQYRHEFSSMYHSISQVVYYNNTSYVRRKQLPLQDVCKCEDNIHVLPLFMQLYPTVKAYKEDECIPINFSLPGVLSEADVADTSDYEDVLKSVLTSHGKNVTWIWFVLPGAVYLLSEHGHVYHSRHTMIPLFNLVATYDKA